MNLAYAYPASRFEPAALVDLSVRAERERLSKSALLGFFNLATAWRLRDEDARELLGGLSSSSFYEWKKNPDRLLEVDRITRISYLTSIYKALHILYGDRLADEWISLPRQPDLSRPLAARRSPSCWAAVCWRCRPFANCSKRGAAACEPA